MTLAASVLILVALVVGVILGWFLAQRSAQSVLEQSQARLVSEHQLQLDRVHSELHSAQGELKVVLRDRDLLNQENRESTSLTEKIEPLRQALESLQKQTTAAQIDRAKTDASIREQIEGVQRNYGSLESATRQLVAAMSSGQSRGQWGEMQLEQLLEHSGLIEGTHFVRQDHRVSTAPPTSSNSAGNGARPDIAISLPAGGEILIDAKFPFDAYWKSIEAGESPEAHEHLKKHARDVLARAKELSDKRYWESNKSPDFVVMFLPLESILSAALSVNGNLLQETFTRNVILATPTSMLPMLRTISFGYQRKLMADNAEEIRKVGTELLNRLESMVDKISGVQRGLEVAVKNYNQFVGSFDSRVLVQARRMKELGVSSNTDLNPDLDVLSALRESRYAPKTGELTEKGESSAQPDHLL